MSRKYVKFNSKKVALILSGGFGDIIEYLSFRDRWAGWAIVHPDFAGIEKRLKQN